MKPKLALRYLAVPPSRRRLLVSALSGCLLACVFLLPEKAEARARGEENIPTEGERPTLRNVLTSTHDAAGKPSERRRLNAEERSALHRDLRDAMRGAYPEQSGGRKKSR